MKRAGRISAAGLGLLACDTCGLVSRPPAAGAEACCPRCGSALHARKPDSLARTTALLIASYILIVPANLMPVMETGSMFGSQKDTIMSGIVYLWVSGSPPLAVVVFIASIVVPLVKLIALTYLVISVKRRSRKLRTQRTHLYRLLEFIGRWSMLDIYVVTLLSALVQLQAFARITPGPAAVAFGAVVVLSMLATMAFDPRLIWDATDPVLSDSSDREPSPPAVPAARNHA
jgi:paraquat-inducible protein A